MFGLDGQNATFASSHRLTGVGHQIHEHLLKLVFGTEKIRQVGVQAALHLDTVHFQQVGVQQQGLFDESIEVQPFRLHLGLAGERQQVRYDAAGAPGFGFHQTQVMLELLHFILVEGVLGHDALHQHDQVQNPGNRIVDLMDHRCRQLAQRGHFVLVQQLLMGFLYLAGAVLDHLFETSRYFFFFFLVLGDVAADMNEFLDFPVLFPDRINIDLIIALCTVRHQAGLDFANLSLVADDFTQRAVSLAAVAGVFYFMINLVTFPADDIFPFVVHLGKKCIVDIDDFHLGGDYHDKILNSIQNRLHLLGSFPQFALLQTDCIPENVEDIVGEQTDTGRSRTQNILENFLLGRQYDNQMDAVTPVVQLMPVIEGQQTQLIGQFEPRARGIGVRHR